MQKIPSLYLRNPEDMSQLTREVNPRCQWVIDGEGRPTVKWDGTCVMLDAHGQWWTRHQVRPNRAIPENYIPIEHDPVTGKTQGWIPMADSQYRKQLTEAIEGRAMLGDVDPWLDFTAGTYELCGPKVGSNPHGYRSHFLIPHGTTPLSDVPTQYDALASWLRTMNEATGYLEGIVWHHEDGRMAKIKTHDFD